MKKWLLVALLVPAAACSRVTAKTPADRPPLEVPPPPPRVIEAAPSIESAQPEPVGDLPAAPPASSRPKPQPRETTREPAKTEPKPETPVEQPSTPPATAPSAPPQSQLRTPGTADAAEAARQVQEVIDRAGKALSTIDYRMLSSERRKAYDQAKEFMEGAKAAMKESNYVFARSLAEKADKLARELQGR